MHISQKNAEYLQVLNDTFSTLEPFIIGGGPFSETIGCFAEFACGFLPLDGIAMIRLSSDGRAKECAIWRDGRVLEEEEIAAYDEIDVPLWCRSLLWEGKNDTIQNRIAKLSGRSENEGGCFSVMPIRHSGELPGIIVAEKAEPWTCSEKETLELLTQTAKSAFITRNYNESQTEQTWVFNQLMDNLRANVYVTDIETDEILFMNKTMRETYGIKHPVGKTCWQVLQKGLKERCEECPVDHLKNSGGADSACIWEEHSTVTNRYYENYDSRMRWLDGRIVHFQQSVDITDNKKILSQASRDELTGMFNRRSGKERLEKALRRASFEQSPLTICLYDVNLLKVVNDTYGHIEGDRMLITIAKAVMGALEKDQFAFRMSGDEFMIVFKGCTEAEADVAVKKILDRIVCEKERQEKPYEISFCYGLLQVPHRFEGLTKLITEVDERMYMQKRAYHASRLNRELVQRQDVSHFTYDKEHLYEALIESTDNYVYLCNMKTNLYRFPPKMVEEFGLPGEIVYDAGTVWGALIEDGKRQEFQKQLEDIAEGKTDTHDLTYRARNKDGKWVKLHCRGKASRDENGEAELFAGVVTKV